ncbi:MAG: hypothetical protein V4613_12925 [Bacteroidota bacterium]
MDNSTDKIDLEGVRQYASGLKNFYVGIVRFKLQALRKYWYILLLGIVLGAAWGWNIHRKAQPLYMGTASFTYTELHKKIYGEMIDKLRTLCLSHSYQALASQLIIQPEVAQKIADIEAVNIDGSPLSDDITQGKLPFYIRVKLTDRLVSEQLLVNLEQYMNDNHQAKVIIKNNSKSMREKIAFFDHQLKKLDSLKNAYRFYMANQGNNPNTTFNTFNPINLYTESEKYFNTKSDLESALENYKVVKILDGFVMADYPYMPSLMGLLLKYTGLGFIIAAVISLLLFGFKKL